MNWYLGPLLLFILLFAIWVTFVIIDELNNAFWRGMNAKKFREDVISLLENPIDKQSDGATWQNVKAIATEYNLSRNFVLYTLENMLSKATSAHGKDGKQLRPHIQNLESIVKGCRAAKDFELLPESIQTHLEVIKTDHPEGKKSVFLQLEQDILKLKTSIDDAFKRERTKSFVSLIFGLLSLLLGVGPFIKDYMSW
ncbi:hypothetical protein [Vibrio diabolicus]|uniref:hypothetical protein n=1 Tax=Vibrio diabolicus TaxID=50719 RepID=UPI003750AC03